MAESLSNFMKHLEATKPGPFVPGAYYYGQEEDSLTIYLRNEESFAHRLNSLITIFISPDSNALVGCQVKGLRRKLLTDGSFGVAISKGGKLQLGLFFHMLAYDVQEDDDRNKLVQLGQETKDIEVDTKDLVPC
jgi:hypothetical protein